VPCVGGQGCGRQVVRPSLAALNFWTMLLNWKGSQQQSRSLRRGRNPILPRVPLTDRYSGPGRSQSATRYWSIGSAGCAVERSSRLRFRVESFPSNSWPPRILARNRRLSKLKQGRRPEAGPNSCPEVLVLYQKRPQMRIGSLIRICGGGRVLPTHAEHAAIQAGG
jgi:hypothetical protein